LYYYTFKVLIEAVLICSIFKPASIVVPAEDASVVMLSLVIFLTVSKIAVTPWSALPSSVEALVAWNFLAFKVKAILGITSETTT
jgi:hypothetical protein